MWREDISGLSFIAAHNFLNPPPPRQKWAKGNALFCWDSLSPLHSLTLLPPSPLPSALPCPLNTKPPCRCGGRTSQAWVSQLPINFLKEYGFDEGDTLHAPSHEH
jgi:hypothetical protein